MTLQHPADRGGSRRGRFATVSEAASNITSSPQFFVVSLVLIAGALSVHLVHPPVPLLILAGDVLTSVNLLLLALLKNSERRAEHFTHQKLDAIATAMLKQYEGHGADAQEELRRVIRMEFDA